MKPQDLHSIPKHMFVADNGDLHDTRVVNWHNRPIRHGFWGHHACIKTPAQFKATLRAGAYAWPGGYQLYLLTSDGGALCFKCARKEARYIIPSIAGKCNDGWQCIACDVNYEDPGLFCDHCSELIPAAYEEPDV